MACAAGASLSARPTRPPALSRRARAPAPGKPGQGLAPAGSPPSPRKPGARGRPRLRRVGPRRRPFPPRCRPCRCHPALAACGRCTSSLVRSTATTLPTTCKSNVPGTKGRVLLLAKPRCSAESHAVWCNAAGPRPRRSRDRPLGPLGCPSPTAIKPKTAALGPFAAAAPHAPNSPSAAAFGLALCWSSQRTSAPLPPACPIQMPQFQHLTFDAPAFTTLAFHRSPLGADRGRYLPKVAPAQQQLGLPWPSPGAGLHDHHTPSATADGVAKAHLAASAARPPAISQWITTAGWVAAIRA